jgi:hypothetical protein
MGGAVRNDDDVSWCGLTSRQRSQVEAYARKQVMQTGEEYENISKLMLLYFGCPDGYKCFKDVKNAAARTKLTLISALKSGPDKIFFTEDELEKRGVWNKWFIDEYLGAADGLMRNHRVPTSIAVALPVYSFDPVYLKDVRCGRPVFVPVYSSDRVYMFEEGRIWRAASDYKAITACQDKAHRIVRRAVKTGELVPQACERCGLPGDTMRDADCREMEAHHEDYGKPLDVVWLCRSCHWDRHGEIKRAGLVSTLGGPYRSPVPRRRLQAIRRKLCEKGANPD